MTSKGRLAEQSESTRAALLAAARELFAEKGFWETSTEDIVRRAAVTRGALYHHFSGKEELFRAVYESIEQEIANASVAAAMAGKEPLDRIRRGIRASLDACLEPGVQRIVLLDAVSVLGWEDWHAIGAKYSFLVLKLGLEAAMSAGAITSRPVEPLTHLLQGAFTQAAMALSRSNDVQRDRPRMEAEIDRLLTSLSED